MATEIWETPSIDKVTENLFIGNFRGARDKELLLEHGITHILICSDDLEKCYVDEYVYHKIEVVDVPHTDLTKFFKTAIDFIESGTKVLVHCFAGMSRSATFVIAYLMVKNKWSFEIALKFLKEKRPIVDPNKGFRVQLRKFEEFMQKDDTPDLGSFSVDPKEVASILLQELHEENLKCNPIPSKKQKKQKKKN